MKALALFSGGLDSLLAAKLIQEQGIEVLALYFDVGFDSVGIEKKKNYLERITKRLGLSFEVINLRDQYIRDILFSPKYGYGKNFNPCIDCHANMFRVAASFLETKKASFIISGEVVGQRPMSQRVVALRQVAKLSGVEGLVLRPLSAKLLPVTIPEEKGWVDREKLLGIEGRGRYRQLELAEKWGLTDYETPSGGCLLTDPYFSRKMKEFIKYDKFEVEDIEVLKFGRHFRLPGGAKLVMGRNKAENEILATLTLSKYVAFDVPENVLGPISLISKNASKNDKIIAAKLVMAYTKMPQNKIYTFEISGEKITVEHLFGKDSTISYRVK